MSKTYSYQYLQHNHIFQLSNLHQLEVGRLQVKLVHIRDIYEHLTTKIEYQLSMR